MSREACNAATSFNMKPRHIVQHPPPPPTRQVLELGAGEQGVEGVAKLVEQRLHL